MTTTTSTCYRRVNGPVHAETLQWVICPEYYGGLCCWLGDECLDEQICHVPKGSGYGRSEYYIGLCTDATYNAPSCSWRCTDDAFGEVTYNPSTNLWACCGNSGNADGCGEPTNETFLAPQPQQLLDTASLRSVATSATAPATTSATNPAPISVTAPATTLTTTGVLTSISDETMTVRSTPSAIIDQTSYMKESAKAGIGVGAALAALAIITLLACVIRLRKNSRSGFQAPCSAGKVNGSIWIEGPPKELQGDEVREHELSGDGPSHEMEAN